MIAGFVHGLSTTRRGATALSRGAQGEAAGGVALAGVADAAGRLKPNYRRGAPSLPRRRRAGLPVFGRQLTSNTHANASAAPVLADWGIDTDGKPVYPTLGFGGLLLKRLRCMPGQDFLTGAE